MGFLFKSGISREEKKADLKWFIKTLGWLVFALVFLGLTFHSVGGHWDWYEVVLFIVWLLMIPTVLAFLEQEIG